MLAQNTILHSAQISNVAHAYRSPGIGWSEAFRVAMSRTFTE